MSEHDDNPGEGGSSRAFDPSGPATFGGIFGLPYTAEQSKLVLVPVPWEPTTSYRKGTAGGPRNILEASRQVDLYDREHGRVYEAGVALLGEDPLVVRMNAEACELAQPIIDEGGAGSDRALLAKLDRVNQLSSDLNDRVDAIASDWISRGKLVGLVGGDHSTPFGLVRSLARKYPDLGILHVDAHADLRNAYEGFSDSHASIMFNIHERLPVSRIVQVGIRDFSEEEAMLSESSSRIRTFYDQDLADRAHAGVAFGAVVAEIVETLPREVYVSFDIDGLDPSLCPGTGTPVPGGLSFREACALLSGVVKSGRRIVGFDLNEVSGEGEWDGIVGARILYKLIGASLASASVR